MSRPTGARDAEQLIASLEAALAADDPARVDLRDVLTVVSDQHRTLERWRGDWEKLRAQLERLELRSFRGHHLLVDQAVDALDALCAMTWRIRDLNALVHGHMASATVEQPIYHQLEVELETARDLAIAGGVNHPEVDE